MELFLYILIDIYKDIDIVNVIGKVIFGIIYIFIKKVIVEYKLKIVLNFINYC